MEKLGEKLRTPTIKQILLTGSPGIGKTTLVVKVCKLLLNVQIPINGFYTQELRSGSSRIGFDIFSIDGKHHSSLARKVSGNGENMKPRVGSYEVDVSSFESIALPELDSRSELSIMIIDEIGKMEMFSKQFEKETAEVFKNKNCIVLATVPSKARIPLVDSLKQLDSSFLIEVNYDNRDFLANILLDVLKYKFETFGRK